MTTNGFDTALERICSGSNLGTDEMHSVFIALIDGVLDPLQITALLIALKTKGESPSEIAGAARALRERASRFEAPDYSVADTCGTGGDGACTVNISTAAAFVAAELGVPVAKHGNRSVSSQCGSADVLEAVGIRISIPPELARRCLDVSGVCFLFAPDYHNGIRHAMPVRKKLKTRTLFNLLGPLANPASPDYQVLGVYDRRWVLPVAETLRELGCRAAAVVHGGGLDELALHTHSDIAFLHEQEIDEFRVHPRDLGLPVLPVEALAGGDPKTNANWLTGLLAGHGDDAHNAAVAMNAGALSWVAGRSPDLRTGVEAAMAVLHSGRALDRLTTLVEVSNGAL